MTRNFFEQFGLDQAALSKILGKGTITNKIRIRAHRIWHGAMPHKDEMKLLHSATNGELSADIFYGLKSPTKHSK